MDTAYERALLARQLGDLPIDLGDGAAVLQCYLMALRLSRIGRLLELSAWPEGYVGTWILPFDGKGPVPEYVRDGQFLEFCQTLKRCGLDENYRDFVEPHIPRLVACWDDFAKLVHGRSAEEVALILLLTIGDTAQDTKYRSISATKRAEEIYQGYSSYFDEWYLSLEEYRKIWKAVHYIPMPELQVKTSRVLAEAVKFYRTHKISSLGMLKDFCMYEQNRTVLEGAVNPWRTYQYEIKHQPARVGVAIAEDAFDMLRKLYREKAVDVVRAAYYPYPALFAPSADIQVKDQYDRLLECAFLYPEFEKLMEQADDILIVNPGPDFLIRCDRYLKKQKQKRCTVAVQNEYLLAAYRSEFRGIRFCLVSDLNGKNGAFDLVGLISTCAEEEMDITEVLSCGGKNGRIMALLPQSVLTQREGIGQMLRSVYCSPEEIIAITSDATVSAPRKKMLLFAGSYDEREHTEVPVFFTQCSRSGKNLIIEKRHILISVDELYRSGKSLTALRRWYETKQKSSGEKLSREKANVYDFSEEIKLRYTIHQNKKDNAFIGTVYYRALSRGNQRNRTAWDSEKMTQEGLRSKDRQAVLAALEDTAYYETLETCITSDLRHHYGGEIGSCSLKTIWFCVRPTLLRDAAYNDSMARTVLFPAGNTALASIFPKDADDEAYRTAMESVIPAEEKTTSKYWKQLNLIFRTCVSLNYLQKNPISRLMTEADKKDIKELRDLRNALTKKTFTPDEEERMFRYVNEPTKIPFGARYARRYEAKSIWLLGAIRMFTGMGLREVCALDWADFVKLDGLDSCQLLVYKFLEDNGTCTYSINQERSKYNYRKIPLAPILTQMLRNRLAFMREVQGYTEEEIRQTPIILDRERTDTEVFEAAYCKYSEAVKSCKKLIEVAEIPTQELVFPGEQERVLDMNKYGGDIYYTNFRHRANHVCAFSRGELSYVLGNKGPDTFSQHYCDYSNDMIQYIMTQKLRRWTYRYEPVNGTPETRNRENRVQSVVCVSSAEQNDLYSCLDITIRGKGGAPDSHADVEISSKYGTTGTVRIYRKGKKV